MSLKVQLQDMTKLMFTNLLAVKKQIIKSANEAASMILKIDDIISSAKMKTPPMPPGGGCPAEEWAWAVWVDIQAESN